MSISAAIWQLGCGVTAASESSGGYSASNHKLLIHCIAFGPQGSSATTILDQMQQLGNVTDHMPSYKIVDGNESTIVSRLRTAVAEIFDRIFR